MNTWIIKILSGSHQGAEIPLKQGAYTLGCSEIDDLIISDVALKESHLTLHINETFASIELHNKEAPIYVNEKEEKVSIGEKNSLIQIAYPDVISIGTLKMVVGKKSQDWSNIKLNTNELLNPDNTELNAHSDMAITPKVKNKKNISLKKKLLTGLALTCLIPLTLITNEDTKGSPVIEVMKQDKWNKIKETFNTDSLTFEEKNDYSTITGRLKKKSEYKNLMALIDIVDLNSKINIHIDEDIERALNQDIFSTLGNAEIKAVISQKLGEFDLIGPAESNDEVNDFIIKAIKKYPEVSKINNLTQKTIENNGPKPINMGINIRSVNLGRTPYFISEDGKRFVNGSTLVSGMIIDGINTEYIRLKKGGELFHHQLGAN